MHKKSELKLDGVQHQIINGNHSSYDIIWAGKGLIIVTVVKGEHTTLCTINKNVHIYNL